MTVSTAPAADRKPKRRRDPLQPLTGVIRVTFYLAVALLLRVLAGIVFSANGSFGWNGGDACLTIPAGMRGGSVPGLGSPDKISTMVTAAQVCVAHAHASQAFLSTIAQGLGLPFFVLAFGLTSRLLSTAGREGVHSDGVARQIRRLGWTLLVGEVVVVVLRVVGSVGLYNQLVADHANGTYWTPFWHVNWAVLLIGLCLLTFARIVREGAGMREDLEGTV